MAPPSTKVPTAPETIRLARNEQFVTDRAGRSPEGVGPKELFVIAPPWTSPRLLTARLLANVLLLSVAGPSLSKAPLSAKNTPDEMLSVNVQLLTLMAAWKLSRAPPRLCVELLRAWLPVNTT